MKTGKVKAIENARKDKRQRRKAKAKKGRK